MTVRLRTVAAVGLVLLVPTIGAVDLLTGHDFSFSVFYVIPTTVAAWYFGRGLGIPVAILTGLTWAYAESVTRIASLPAATWNRGSRLLILVAFAYLLDQVRRNQDGLRRLLRQRDEFLSLIAHELRAPVAAIEIVATGLSRAPALGASERRAMGQLLDQARGLSTLAEDLLAVGQLEAGSSRLEPRRFDLRTVVSRAAEDEPRVRLTSSPDPVIVSADESAITRALANVLGNALKFSGPEAPVDLGVHQEDGSAVVRVVDRGIGLGPGEARALFRKYGRIRNEATSRIPGAGLGLYFTQLIMRAHGGGVTATSAGLGQGSTFELRLPAAPVGMNDALAPGSRRDG